MEDIEAVVIGAGVVGLAVARELALSGRETLILEAADAHRLGHQRAQQRGDPRRHLLPARLAQGAPVLAGRERLYAFCRKHAVAHRRCGKLIVATEAAQRPALAAIARSRARQRRGTADR